MENMENKNKEQETKETKREVTNEMLYEAMQHLMVGQACILTTHMTLFNMMLEHKSELKLTDDEVDILEHGLEAFECTINGLESHAEVDKKIAEARTVKGFQVVEVSSPKELEELMKILLR